MSDKIVAKQFVVRGRVQGVGFRWFVKRAADELGVKGFVRNLHDGRVEARAEGTEKAVTDFRREIETGPSFANVTELQELDVAAVYYSDFSITY